MIEVEADHWDSTVVPDITSGSSIRIRSILAVGVVIEGISRYSRLCIARYIEEEELLSMVD